MSGRHDALVEAVAVAICANPERREIERERARAVLRAVGAHFLAESICRPPSPNPEEE